MTDTCLDIFAFLEL